MKKMKKLLALVLAMMMAFSLMAVTAAYNAEEHEHTYACSEETIQPRIPAMLCPKCRNEMNAVRVYDDMGQTYVDFVCPIDDTRVNRVPW